jgi:hypothetical protein
MAMTGGHLAGVLVMLAIAAGFGAMAGYYVLLGQRYRVTFYDDAVELDMVFKRRRVMKADVTGWTWGENDGSWSALIYLHLKEGKRIELPLADRKHEAVDAWFDGLENPEAIAEAKSVKAVLADRTWGITPDERLAALNRERRIASWIQIAGLAAMLWVVIWPRPYPVALVAGLALPVIVFILAVMLKDRWAFGEDTPADQRPNLYPLLLLSPFAIVVRAASDYRIVEYGWVILVAALLGVVTALLTTLLLRKETRLSWSQAMLAIPFAVYAYGAIVVADVELDASAPETFTVDVIKSDMDEDGDCKVTVAAWGPYRSERSLNVSRWLQQRAPAGSRVCMNLHRGLLGVRWWTVRAIETAAPAAPS